jgi:tRNA(Arg) A34 adenosine deaminase TadA
MKKTPPVLPDFIVDMALQKAKEAFIADEIPVGAVVFHSDTFEVVSVSHNETECQNNPMAHAEMVAIRQACEKLNVKQLVGYSIFTTLEPCVMCAGAIGWARLDTVYFGASDPKSGAIDQGAQVFTHPQTHHKPQVVRGIRAEECGALMTEFFKNKRLQQKEKKNLK